MVFDLIDYHRQPQAVLELRQTPRLPWDQLIVTQLHNKQIRQQGNAKRLFKWVAITSNLMLAQSQVRFQISIDELYIPAILVQPYHLSCGHIRQIGQQELCVARADVPPGFAEHQAHVSNVAQTQVFGIDPIRFALVGLGDTRYPVGLK